jgi:hypothetical protein
LNVSSIDIVLLINNKQRKGEKDTKIFDGRIEEETYHSHFTQCQKLFKSFCHFINNKIAEKTFFVEKLENSGNENFMVVFMLTRYFPIVLDM